MSKINQIQLRFIPAEDRLVLRMNTTDSVGFEFLLTRRYVRLLWPILMDMLHKDEQIASQATAQARKEVLSFQHQAAAQSMDFSKPFRTQSDKRPLGESPILLAKISVKQHDNGTPILCLLPEQGQGIELTMEQTLLHSFCKLMGDTVAKTDWNLDLPVLAGEPATTAEVKTGMIN